MKFASVQKMCGVTTLLAAIAASCGGARAQGLMEYGGLMAMPKMVPTGDMVKGLSKTFGSVSNAMPGGAASDAAQIPASVALKRPDGTIVVDPKKVKAAVTKVNADELAADTILKKSNATAAELKIAEKNLREAIAIRSSIWSYQDPAIPKLLNKLGMTYERLKQPATAKACYKNGIAFIFKKYGDASPERLDIFLNLAPLLVKEGDMAGALSIQQQIAMLKDRKNGANADTMQAMLTWAGTAKSLEKPNLADIYKQCLDELNKSGGKIPADQVVAYKREILPNYLEALKKAGRDEDAEEAAKLLESLPPAPPPAAAASAPAAGASASGASVTPASAPAAGASASGASVTPSSSPAAAQATSAPSGKTAPGITGGAASAAQNSDLTAAPTASPAKAPAATPTTQPVPPANK